MGNIGRRQNTTSKTKDWVTRTPQKTEREIRCSTSDICGVIPC